MLGPYPSGYKKLRILLFYILSMPSAQNSRFGIFRSKCARDLALKYNLDLNDKRAYMTISKLVNYYDVAYIVDNLWLDYFNGHTNPPADVSMEEYQEIHDRLIRIYLWS